MNMAAWLTNIINFIILVLTTSYSKPPLLFCSLLENINYLNIQVKTWLELIEIPI